MKTLSTTTTLKSNSILKTSKIADDSRYYLNDKTKKCVRAMNNNIFGDKTKNVESFAGNLAVNDPGHKKVRFVEDLKKVVNNSEMILGGFSDKRDFKDFKRKMIRNCWETNVEEKK